MGGLLDELLGAWRQAVVLKDDLCGGDRRCPEALLGLLTVRHLPDSELPANSRFGRAVSIQSPL